MTNKRKHSNGGEANLPLGGFKYHMMNNIITMGMGKCYYDTQQNYEEQDVRIEERHSWYGLPEWKDKINLKTKDLTKELLMATVLLVAVANNSNAVANNLNTVGCNLNTVGCNNIMWSGALSSNMQDKCRL